ncbi:MAG: beta-ketoacyl-ACP reductase [Erysipelotrichaceae bacterium]|nr:beta-ketoacyl-ACP reductase [Erysipelotrichaceae bacterium]
MNLLKDKVAVITGASKGIGKQTAVKMAEEGALVYACSRSKADYYDDKIRYLQLDVTDKDSCQNVFDAVMKEHGRVDVLVCNAGITADKMTAKMSDEDFDRVIDTNLKGVFNMIRIFGPQMEGQGKGSIVAISSIVGEQGNIGQANYAASKAGIIGMCKSFAKEFSRKGAQVRVNAIAPGYILTDMVKTVREDLLEKFASQTMLKRLGEPEEIANVVAFLSSDEASYITGTVIDVNGGMRL